MIICLYYVAGKIREHGAGDHGTGDHGAGAEGDAHNPPRDCSDDDQLPPPAEQSHGDAVPPARLFSDTVDAAACRRKDPTTLQRCEEDVATTCEASAHPAGSCDRCDAACRACHYRLVLGSPPSCVDVYDVRTCEPLGPTPSSPVAFPCWTLVRLATDVSPGTYAATGEHLTTTNPSQHCFDDLQNVFVVLCVDDTLPISCRYRPDAARFTLECVTIELDAPSAS